jgi:hypothetical protein
MWAGWVLVLWTLASTTTAQATQAALGSSGRNSCPAQYTQITTMDLCRAAVELVAGDGDREDWRHAFAGQESDSDFPSGCYFFDQGSSWGGYYLNNHASGAGEADSSPLCISEADGFVSGATLFVGDSDIDFWATHAAFPGSYNVGVRGDTCQDVLRRVESLLATFAPTAVVLVCGENDLAAGASVALTLERLTEVGAAMGKVEIVTVGWGTGRQKMGP